MQWCSVEQSLEMELADRFDDPATAIHIHAIDDGTEEIVHVNSYTLAKHSPFFGKLFTTEMRGDSDVKNIFELRVDNISELHCLVKLVEFVCGGQEAEALASSCQEELLHLLMVADKYQVACFATSCVDQLKETEFTKDFALRCFETLPVTSQLQPLITAAGDYLQKSMRLEHCADLSPSTMELILKSDQFHLSATSEYEIYKMLLRWAEASEERQQALFWLIEHIRFSDMLAVDMRILRENLKLRRVSVSESTRKKIKSLSMNGLYQRAESGPRHLVEVGLDEDMKMHVGKHVFGGLVDFGKLRVKFWVKLPISKSLLQRQAKEAVAETLKIPVESQRIWWWRSKYAGPDEVIREDDAAQVVPPSWGGSIYLYSEVGPPGVKPDTGNKTLTFVTFYDNGSSSSRGESLSYVGRLWVETRARVIPVLSHFGPLVERRVAAEIALEVQRLAGCFRSEVLKLAGSTMLEDLVPENNIAIRQGSVFCCGMQGAREYIISNQKKVQAPGSATPVNYLYQTGSATLNYLYQT